MVRKCTEKDRSLLMEYLREEAVYNTFLLADITDFGFEESFQTVYIDEEEEKIKGVYLCFYENFLLYCKENEVNAEFLKQLFSSYTPDVIMGNIRDVQKVQRVLPDYAIESRGLYQFCHPDKLADETAAIQKADAEDVDDIFAFLQSIPELKHLYTSKQMIADRIGKNVGTHYIIRENGQIIAHANSAAQSEFTTMIGGVSTAEAYRSRGLAGQLVSRLCRDIQAKGKQPTLFGIRSEENNLYNKNGFEKIGEWGTLTKAKGQTEKKTVIEFENFEFQYFSQAEPTLHDINLKICEGEKVLIVGPSGSGKSTIGNCLNGLIPFSYRGEIKGSLKIGGKETRDMNIFELSKKVGTVLQDADGQFVGLTVGEDIAFALENDCVAQTQMKETVQKVADIVDMGKLLKSSPFELSGGQKQRVSFAGVMVDDVDILLFDEPLANLDPATGKTAIDLIDKVWKESKKTVVIIEHRLEDVLYRDVDRIIVVSDGKIAADMTPDELMAADILTNLGIREPLYVTALKYAGIEVTPDMKAGRMDTLDVERIAEPLQKWNREQEEKPKAEERPTILAAEHLSFQYTKKRKILQDINFQIQEGEMVSIVGTNGAGKSTLAKVICGFVTEDEGKLLYYGEDLKGQTIKERSLKIGYVMQNPNQMICKPMIYDEVALGLRIRGVSEEEIEPRVDKALKICGLSPFKKWPISALSFGQKKRVTIASMLVMNPQVLILDEPTAGQDYHHYTEIMQFLKSLNEQGVTIIMITHDMHLMLEYTPHAIVISNGKKIGDASAVEILTNEEITGQANLKVTSLYELAQKAGIENPSAFVQKFIDYERGTKR